MLYFSLQLTRTLHARDLVQIHGLVFENKNQFLIETILCKIMNANSKMVYLEKEAISLRNYFFKTPAV